LGRLEARVIRKLALLFVLVLHWLPALAARPVTVEQLQQVLAEAQGKKDAEVAKELSDLELTERVSPAMLAHWDASLPGPKAQMALVALTDASAFLNPPTAEIPSKSAPDLAAQRQMMSLTVEYVGKTIQRLPNFFATRDTIRFEDIPVGYREDLGARSVYEPLHVVDKSSATVLFRDGKEVVDTGKANEKKTSPFGKGLTTRGVFGAILGIVIIDAAQGNLSWSHWEESPTGARAVFHYIVLKDKSHYQLDWCCVSEIKDRMAYLHIFHEYSGYHGEIAIDPADGAILRLTLEADLNATDPISEAAIEVQYGPVDIGGKSYICPIRSVSLSREPAQIYLHLRPTAGKSKDPQKTSLNDVNYGQYHLFRAESRILPGDYSASEAGLPDAGAPNGNVANGKESFAASSAVPGQAASTGDSAPPSTELAAVVPVPPGAVTASLPASEALEISVTEATDLPESATASTEDAGDSGFVLRTASRPVDVSVVALDKEGHPVMGLTRDDFTIYDEGEKEPIQEFTAPAAQPTVGTVSPPAATAIGPRNFTNQRAEIADGANGTGAAPVDSTVLLIDENHLASSDVAYVREGIVRFLKSFPAGERVSLYVLNGHRFQFLSEPTSDIASLMGALSRWTPTVQRETNPQNSESIPTQEEMSMLVGLARHLAVIAGRKNLVWIGPDSFLSELSGSLPNSEKGITHIDEHVLGVQEAMSDARVGVYPIALPSSNGAEEAIFGNLAAGLGSAVAESKAAYQLSFIPDLPPDDKYHRLALTLTTPRDMTLRYRPWYLYQSEPATLNERFHDAVWQVADANEIQVTATPGSAVSGDLLKINIAAAGLGLVQEGGLRTDKVDVFLAERGDPATKAKVTGQVLSMRMASATYQKVTREGIQLDQPVDSGPETDSVRIIVVDENSGKIGSVTVPAAAFPSAH